MSSSSLPPLTPVQARAYEALRHALRLSPVVRLTGQEGRGRSLLMRHLQQEQGGLLLTWRDLLPEQERHHPLAFEESFFRVVSQALAAHRLVMVDDLQVLARIGMECGFAVRPGFWEAPLLALIEAAEPQGRQLVLASSRGVPQAVMSRGAGVVIDRFAVEDYTALCAHWLENEAADIDFAKLFRFAPKLNGHQLRAACTWVRESGRVTTDALIEYMRSQRLASNVDLGEVEAVDLTQLQGVEDVIRSLEIHIALPLENDAVAEQWELRPKRGVLLYGPPGTGKTTIGRALAHRLRGKFFLIDGTFIAGTAGFYDRVNWVFESAKDNAPAVIFIDDADAIFESGEEQGLYRYLLTMLDGLESEGAGRVCVMLTAMDVSHLPPALVRSGRVELWLEMKLPDAEARGRILQQHLLRVPDELQRVDVRHVVEVTDGFTGADLKRMVEDAKGLYAFDYVGGRAPRSATHYIREAAEGVRRNKQRYAEAEAAARAHAARPRPSWGGYPVMHMGGSDQE